MKYEYDRWRWQMKMIDEDNRRDDMVNRKDMKKGWKMNNDRWHAKRHEIFPEDDTVVRITISR